MKYLALLLASSLSSMTDYECHAGAIIAGVALIGDVATLAR